MASWGHNFNTLKSTKYQKGNEKVWFLQGFFFVLEKKMFDFLIVSSFFKIISPFEGELALHLNKVKYPYMYHKDALCQFYVILPNGP